MIIKPLNKRTPEIPDSLLPDYCRMSKADLIEICFSFAQMIYGEDEDASVLMEKIKEERETLKSNRVK